MTSTLHMAIKSATIVDTIEFPLPPWVLGLARTLALQCGLAEATEGHTLIALALTTMAGEAIVNRLLEPLVEPTEWPFIERARVEEKWELLSTKLKLEPALVRGKAPLKDYLETTAIRNALTHFKDGANRVVEEMPLEVIAKEGGYHLGAPTGPMKTTQQSRRDLRTALQPVLARKYFESLENLLLPVLKNYPDDAFKIAQRLTDELCGKSANPDAPTHAPPASDS